MENQYNYYQPDNEYSKDIFDERPNGDYRQNNSEGPKKKRKMPKGVKFVGAAVAFGVIASAAFLTTNAVAGRFLKSPEIGSTTLKEPAVSDSAGIKLKQSSSTVMSDISDIVEQSMPSVVSITNMSVQEVQSFFGGVQQRESQSCGSGIIIGKNDTELLIVTNNHVVEGAKTLTVSFVDDTVVEATVKGADASKDLAVAAVPLDSIEESTMNAIKISTLGDSDNLQVGEPVIAIGNALGYGQSVTNGIVSALDRDLEMEGFDSKLIQTNAAINPGNSGGALLNAKGELIGINTVKVNANAVEGMGYAIPISDASEVIETLMNRETRTLVPEKDRGYLGIQGVDVTSDSAQMYNMPTGVYIAKVVKNGAIDKAGVSKGTIITKFDGITIDSMATLQEQLQYFRIGEDVEIVVQVPGNNGEYTEQTITVTLGERSE